MFKVPKISNPYDPPRIDGLIYCSRVFLTGVKRFKKVSSERAFSDYSAKLAKNFEP